MEPKQGKNCTASSALIAVSALRLLIEEGSLEHIDIRGNIGMFEGAADAVVAMKGPLWSEPEREFMSTLKKPKGEIFQLAEKCGVVIEWRGNSRGAILNLP